MLNIVGCQIGGSWEILNSYHPKSGMKIQEYLKIKASLDGKNNVKVNAPNLEV